MLLSLFLALAASAESLDGRWIQDCRSGYQREEIFSGNKATYTERNFWDKSCTDLAVETISRGTIRLGKPALRPEGAEDIDFVFESVSLKPTSAKTVEAWQGRAVCGIRNWVLGEEREITGRECDFFGLGSVARVPSKGDSKFGIVMLVPGALYFGQLSPERNGSSPEKRPQELDPRPFRFFPR